MKKSVRITLIAFSILTIILAVFFVLHNLAFFQQNMPSQENKEINNQKNNTDSQQQDRKNEKIDANALRGIDGIIVSITQKAIYIKRDNGNGMEILIDKNTIVGKEQGNEIVDFSVLKNGMKIMAAVNGYRNASLIVIKATQ